MEYNGWQISGIIMYSLSIPGLLLALLELILFRRWKLQLYRLIAASLFIGVPYSVVHLINYKRQRSCLLLAAATGLDLAARILEIFLTGYVLSALYTRKKILPRKVNI